MYRNFSSFKIKNSHYLLLAVAFIIFNYYVFMFHFMPELLESYPFLFGTIIFFFHIFFILMFWSLIRAIISDPGRVPVYWGLFIDDPDNKKRRYCLICHIFKPVQAFFKSFLINIDIINDITYKKYTNIS
jgi:hypothetical protein